jgi:hypothetical protein
MALFLINDLREIDPGLVVSFFILIGLITGKGTLNCQII